MKKSSERQLIFDKEGINAFATQFKKIREAKNYSQAQLAFEAGISQSQIARIETGKTNPTISTVFAVARALNVDIADFFKIKLK